MNKSILIVGKADTLYNSGQITRYDSLSSVEYFFGKKSELTKAFSTALEYGAKEVYLSNAQTQLSYIDIFQIAKQYDFSYIVPLGVRLSDYVTNTDTRQKVNMANLLLKIIASMSDSIVVFTDNHAELYDDIDHFLKDMLDKIRNVKIESRGHDAGRQMLFCSNQLVDIDYSNVVLAAILSSTEEPDYPTAAIPDSVFDIDDFDVKNNELIYFKNNINSYNSIENLVNFNNNYDVYKIVPIDMVIRRIGKELDLSEFTGKLFTGQVELMIQTHLNDYLKSITGKLIRDYKILAIDSKKRSDFSLSILVLFEILPINSIERCDVVIEA